MNQVHGLGSELVAPDWPAPTWRELAPVLDRYGLQLRGGETWISPRPLSSGVKVVTDDGPVFVKRQSERVRTVRQLEQEHDFAGYLAARGIPVPVLCRTAAGTSAISLAGWTYEVHRPASGTDVYRDAMSWTPFNSVEHARASGEMLAHVHLAAVDYALPERDTDQLTSRPDCLRGMQSAAVIENIVRSCPSMQEVFTAGDDARLTHRLQQLGDRLAPLPTQWCHLDWHASNLFWDGNEVACVIDFGLADRSLALLDLAIALERNVIKWLNLPRTDIAVTDHAQAVVAGYEAVRPLSATERELLPVVLPLCHLDFALSETFYFASILNDPVRAGIAWRDYALAHTAWFDTPAGSALLDSLR